MSLYGTPDYLRTLHSPAYVSIFLSLLDNGRSRTCSYHVYMCMCYMYTCYVYTHIHIYSVLERSCDHVDAHAHHLY